MFEAAIMPAVAETGGALRPLEWNEVVARLAAARDLRGLFSRPTGEAGSFMAGAGIVHAALGEPGVNLAALGRGKAPATIEAPTAEEAAMGDQGTR